MGDAIVFWSGFLLCGLVLLGGELLNDHIESRLRIRAARRRGGALG